jgi:hypothetical protein
MKGWNGKILRVDLTKGTAVAEEYSEDFAKRFVGGRGFAVKLLWDELKPGVDPLGPENMLIFATGPLTGHVIPNSGKMDGGRRQEPPNRRVRGRQLGLMGISEPQEGWARRHRGHG